MDGDVLGTLAKAAGFENLGVAEAMKLFRFGQMVADAAEKAERGACASVRVSPNAFAYRTRPESSVEYDEGFCDGINALRDAIAARSNASLTGAEPKAERPS